MSTRHYTLTVALVALLGFCALWLRPAPSYRADLLAANPIAHSPTFTFDAIYVLSLPSRTDRRELMLKLASALDVRIIFVDAVDKELPFVKWIAERVAETRREKLRLISSARGIPLNKLGGLGIGSYWLSHTADVAGRVPFPDLTLDGRFPSGSWVDHLESAYEADALDTLRPANPHLNISQILYDPLERIGARQVNQGVISTFWGHTRAMRLMQQNGDRSALILEDDVDVEFDFEHLWGRIERKLPDTWESVFVGHCWGKEYRRNAYLHPHLHLSTSPLCLHAYALSDHGASHILSLLSDPWSAYSTAIDSFVPTLIAAEEIVSFSIEPPLIIQRKNGHSDIQPGIGSPWRGLLADSTIERIWRHEGTEFDEDVYSEGEGTDPATVFMGGTICRNCPIWPA